MKEERKKGRKGGREGVMIFRSREIEMAKRSSSFRACLIVTFAVGMVLVLGRRVVLVSVVVLDARRKRRLRISNVGTGPINIFGII